MLVWEKMTLKPCKHWNLINPKIFIFFPDCRHQSETEPAARRARGVHRAPGLWEGRPAEGWHLWAGRWTILSDGGARATAGGGAHAEGEGYNTSLVHYIFCLKQLSIHWNYFLKTLYLIFVFIFEQFDMKNEL